jgi:hypothetical protein
VVDAGVYAHPYLGTEMRVGFDWVTRHGWFCTGPRAESPPCSAVVVVGYAGVVGVRCVPLRSMPTRTESPRSASSNASSMRVRGSQGLTSCANG